LLELAVWNRGPKKLVRSPQSGYNHFRPFLGQNWMHFRTRSEALAVSIQGAYEVRLGAVLLFAACAMICGAAQASVKVIAFEDSVTGPNGDINRLEDGMINGNSRVVFYGTDSDNDDGFGVALPEAAHFFVREGDQAPGAGTGVTFDSFDDDRQWNDLGQIAFRGELTGPGVNTNNRGGLWAGSPGDLRMIAREGDLMPGSGAARIETVANDFELGGNGYVAFASQLTDNRYGIWAGTQGNLQAVAIDGQPAVGFPGMSYSLLDTIDDGLSINHSNHLAFAAWAEAELEFQQAVWTGTPGNLQVVAYTEMPAPGFAAGAEVYYFVLPPQINESNEVAIPVGVDDPNSVVGVVDTLYLHSNSGLTRMFDPYSTPPGYAPGSEYSQVLDYNFGNDGNAVMLNPVLLPGGDSEDALFAIRDDDVRLVIRVGDQIPQATGDLYFDYFHQFFVNSAGEVAFYADVAGDEVQSGIWIGDGAGELLEIARTGTTLEIAPGDVRIVSDVLLLGGGFADPERSPFNDAGQLVFYAAFEDSTAALLLYSPAGTPGDYNGDGLVDAADYTVWRDHLGTNANLPNDETPGSVTSGDYMVWRSNFGQSAGSGSLSLFDSAVPEPTNLLALLTCMTGLLARCRGFRRRQANQSAGM
jgi:hypothetical protein